ncbi:MAG TPA: Mur ligase family protein [Candidatus Paceibacterota bacterium]|jgi:UDP-N-acetylmuramoylalanine--D-glutamate ligase|nr:Mur ligase family protein [Candidatus Paceibacterota bacterium]
MEPWRAFFAGKKVTLMGLGLLGRGIGDAAFIAGLGADLTVTDLKPEEKLAPALEQLKGLTNIRYVLGHHDPADFVSADMIIKAAGVPLGSPCIEEAHKAGVPVYMSTALFAKFAIEAGATLVGVTGTRGKSTVTHLIYHTLKQARQQAGRQVHLGGNVRGLSTLAMLPDVHKGDVVVLELDSWQLQGFGDLGISPQVAVFTNLMQDHLNYYVGMDLYFADKAKIFTHQKPSDTLVVGEAIAKQIKAAHPPAAPQMPPHIPDSWKLKIVGEHNRQNASLAAAALRALGIDEKKIRAGLESFGGVEGRMQHLATIKGVHIYNDNNSSTPDAVMVALNALVPLHPVTIIMGGADKKVRLEALAHQVGQGAKRIILLPGTGTDNLKPLLKKYDEAADIGEALKMACKGAKAGEAILFSPGFASFSQFANEYERNDEFVRQVKALK